MKNQIHLCSLKIAIVLIINILEFSAIQAQSFLKAEGSKIINEEGKTVIWRSMGLGGFMLQEGYMLHTAGFAGTQHEIMNKIEELVGKEGKDKFYEAWLANHCTKADVDSLAAWGFNAIRLPMHYKWYTLPIEDEPIKGKNTWLEKGFVLTDSLLSWCKANQMYLILDMHGAPGGQGKNADISDYDPTKPSLWESEENKQKLIALWRKLAEKYTDEPYIGGYDLINEPNWSFGGENMNGCSDTQNAPLWELQRAITQAIREVDTKHIVIVEGNCWGNNYGGFYRNWDDNLVMSFHKYWNPNDQNAIQGMINLANTHQMPLWMGESGENANTWFTNAINLLETNGIGWSWWPLKKLGSNNPVVVKTPKGWQKLLDYWNGNGEKPTPENAQKYLIEFAEAMNIKNARIARDVVDAMIRQPHTDETIPFNSLQNDQKIFASEYDLGKNGFAYFDTYASNTSGSPQGGWNAGGEFRNDGVDITKCQDQTTNGYHVGWVENNEWLLYTVNIRTSGFYQFDLRTSSRQNDGKLLVEIDGNLTVPIFEIPSTIGWQTLTKKDVYLEKGTRKIKLKILQKEYNLNYFEVHSVSEIPTQPNMLPILAQMQADGNLKLSVNQEIEGDIADLVGNFEITHQNKPLEIENLTLEDKRTLIFTLKDVTILYGNEVKVSYQGTGIKSVFGLELAEFSEMQAFYFFANPYNAIFPARLEAENFIQNQGFSTENTTDTGGGQNIGYTDVNDVLEYRVFVSESGIYAAQYRIAAEGNERKSFQVEIFDENEHLVNTHQVDFQATGGWQNWKTTPKIEVSLEAGIHKIRLKAITAQFNFNWMQYDLKTSKPTSIEKGTGFQMFQVFPNPSHHGRTKIQFVQNHRKAIVQIFDMSGNQLFKKQIPANLKEFVLDKLLTQGIYLIRFEDDEQILTQKLVVE